MQFQVSDSLCQYKNQQDAIGHPILVHGDVFGHKEIHSSAGHDAASWYQYQASLPYFCLHFGRGRSLILEWPKTQGYSIEAYSSLLLGQIKVFRILVIPFCLWTR